MNNPLSFIDPSGYCVTDDAPKSYSGKGGELPCPGLDEVQVVASRIYDHLIGINVTTEILLGYLANFFAYGDMSGLYVTEGDTPAEEQQPTDVTEEGVGNGTKTQGKPQCTFDSVRAQTARSNPTSHSNLAPGTYASKTSAFSAGYFVGTGIENRYLADFTTRTVHQLSYTGGTLGYRFGASMQWSGGSGGCVAYFWNRRVCEL